MQTCTAAFWNPWHFQKPSCSKLPCSLDMFYKTNWSIRAIKKPHRILYKFKENNFYTALLHFFIKQKSYITNYSVSKNSSPGFRKHQNLLKQRSSYYSMHKNLVLFRGKIHSWGHYEQKSRVFSKTSSFCLGFDNTRCFLMLYKQKLLKCIAVKIKYLSRRHINMQRQDSTCV